MKMKRCLITLTVSENDTGASHELKIRPRSHEVKIWTSTAIKGYE